MNIRNKLIVNDKARYGENYQAHSLEIYKLYTQMADNISARRQSANSFLLTANIAIIAFVGYVGENPGNLIVSLAGTVVCFIWYRIIRSYKDLNSGKFKVIHEIEKELPFSPYEAEWEALGRGKDSKRYLPFTSIESYVPVIFGILHVLSFFIS